MWQSEIAHQMALLPVIALVALHLSKRDRDASWWWLASAFAVSWWADTAADLMPLEYGWVPSLVYPVSQGAMVGAVLLPRRDAMWLLCVLVIGCLAVVGFSGVGPEAALRALAWLPIAWIVWKRPEVPQRLRMALAVYYGLGWCLWLVHVRWLIVETWYPYQVCRLVGLLLFCWAALDTRTRLHVLHSTRSVA